MTSTSLLFHSSSFLVVQFLVAVLLPDLSLTAVTDFQCLQGHGDNLA
jgi:hypothetical protein